MMKIFVANLPIEYDEMGIATLFITYGDISTINLVTDPRTGRSKGFAFIEMPNDEEALNAISHLDKMQITYNKQLAVSQAQDRPRTNTGYSRSPQRGGGGQRGGYGGNNRNNNYSRDNNRNDRGYDRKPGGEHKD
jgi:RNA recognition motif-containing protein